MHQMELLLDRITGQSLGQPACFPLGSGQAFPRPLVVDHWIANCAPVRDAEYAARPLSILYCVRVIVTARADPVRHKGGTHIWSAMFRMAIDAAHSLSLMLIINDRPKTACGMAGGTILIDRGRAIVATRARSSVGLQCESSRRRLVGRVRA